MAKRELPGVRARVIKTAILSSPSDTLLFDTGLPMATQKAARGKKAPDGPEGASRGLQIEDRRFGKRILDPPLSLERLAALPTESSILRQCIEAMVTNVDAYGWDLEYIGPPAQKESAAAVAEATRIKTFFLTCNVRESFVSLRRKVRYDMESTGNGYFEVLRSVAGDIAGLEHLVTSTMRMMPLDREPVEVNVDLIGADGLPISRRVFLRFRRYVQVLDGRKVYFKELGDPRPISARTGRVIGDETQGAGPSDDVALGGAEPTGEDDDVATEVLHLAKYNPDSPYGLPSYIGALPAIRGSRFAEMVNLKFFEKNAVPSMMVLVSGGALTPESFEEIKGYFQEEMGGLQNFHRVVVLEAVPKTGNVDAEKGHVAIEVKPLQKDSSTDGQFQDYDQANIKKVRSTFRLPPIFCGLTDDTNFACYDDDTEALTERGWLRWNAWTPGTRVLCFDPATGRMQWDEPSELLAYDFDGELYAIRNGVTDMRVTPGHRMCTASGPGQPWEIQRIEDVVDRRRLILPVTAAAWDGLPMEAFSIPFDPLTRGPSVDGDRPLPPMPPALFLETVGMYLSEGGTTEEWTTQWAVGQAPGPKLQRVEAWLGRLERFGVRIAWNVSESGRVTYSNICNKGLRNWLVRECGMRQEVRRIPRELLELPREQLTVLFEAMMLGDGTTDRRQGRTARAYYTTSPELAGQVQELAIKLGLRAHVRPAATGPYGVRPCYRVLLSAHATATVYQGQITRVPYRGKVWCFTVPTGVFVTRRNGTVAVQGNTAQAAQVTAEQQVFQPERNQFDELINLRLLRPMGVRFWNVFTKGPEVADVATYTAAVQAFNAVGAMTPNQAIELANELLGTTLEPVAEDWGNTPFAIVQELLRQDKLDGLEGITKEPDVNPLDAAVSALGGKPAAGPDRIPPEGEDRQPVDQAGDVVGGADQTTKRALGQLLQLQLGVARQLRGLVDLVQKEDLTVGAVATGGGVRTMGPLRPRRRGRR